eukprot:6196312-Ditylum_brightwellii.AAC.1
MVEEKGGKENKDNIEGDNAGSKLHNNRRETSDSSEESGSDNSKVSNHDNLNVSQSKCHVKGGKQMATIGVAKSS